MAGPAAPRARLQRLSSSDIDAIRAALAAGRRPRVVFTSGAGQVAGEVGHVVHLADPNAADEWIIVRYQGDELPFAPTDLALPGPMSRRPGTPPPGSGRRNGPKTASVTVPPPREEAHMLTPTEPAAAAPSIPASAEPQTPGGPLATTERVNGSSPEVRRYPRPQRPKPPALLAIAISYADREWTVAATQGARTLAKPSPIRPADALRLVAMLDVPGVHDAVESIIAAERAEAEGRAQRLRAELAEIESRLAELTNRD